MTGARNVEERSVIEGTDCIEGIAGSKNGNDNMTAIISQRVSESKRGVCSIGPERMDTHTIYLVDCLHRKGVFGISLSVQAL